MTTSYMRRLYYDYLIHEEPTNDYLIHQEPIHDYLIHQEPTPSLPHTSGTYNMMTSYMRSLHYDLSYIHHDAT